MTYRNKAAWRAVGRASTWWPQRLWLAMWHRHVRRGR
jgi:hypothetical protein